MNLRKRLFRRLDKAAAALKSAGPVEERVHEARRQLKKARALAALGRGGDGSLRKAACALSGVRDAEIAARTCAALGLRGPRRELESRRRAEESSAGIAAAAALRHIDSARAKAARLKRPKARALGKAVARAARKVIRRGERALREPDNGALHAWRKAAKRLDGMLGESRRPTARVRAARARLDELGRALGDDHDLAVLRAALERDGGRSAASAAAERGRAKLLEKAARLAPELARVSPRALGRDFRRSF